MKENFRNSEVVFRKGISLFSLTCMAIGLTIGGGVFVLSGIVGASVGRYLPWLYAVAAIPMFFAIAPVAALGTIFPACGGNYFYPSRFLSPLVAFLGIWFFIVTASLGQMPLFCIATAKFLESFFPESETTLAFLILSFFYLLNLFGLRFVVWIQTSMVVLLVAGLLVFIGFSVPAYVPSLPSVSEFPGWKKILYGVSLLTFTYFGSNAIVEFGNETTNPGKNLFRAFFLAFPIVTILYIGVAYAVTGYIPKGTSLLSENPVTESAKILFPELIYSVLIIFCPVLALGTSINGLFLILTSSSEFVIQDGIFPEFLNRKFFFASSKPILLTLFYILSLFGLIGGWNLEILASYSTLGWLFLFLPLLIVFLKLEKRFRNESRILFPASRFFLKISAYWGLFFILLFILFLLNDLREGGKLLLLPFVFAAGLVYYLFRMRYLRRFEKYRKRFDRNEEDLIQIRLSEERT
ncbi:APC family permease [Leptospira adleri]|uniref:Amino acid permease n=1 Tax=Leptospira adleri TaxID=2023186 RepID=A0A2M9YUN1_9LEPT|nr:APC family permease [Leptospira adleri]PJZ55225.1 hypothetical protein CH380_01580 [Leptospira adleri]PJZ63393.1 hypothetical protein CH376_02845 [Leptospira adleri]